MHSITFIIEAVPTSCINLHGFQHTRQISIQNSTGKLHLVIPRSGNVKAACIADFFSLQALQHAARTIQTSPKMQEAYLLQARAFLQLGKFSAAIKSCSIAEQIANVKSTGLTAASKLMDDIAIRAAEAGSVEGFDGRQLQACLNKPSRIFSKTSYMCAEAQPHHCCFP